MVTKVMIVADIKSTITKIELWIRELLELFSTKSPPDPPISENMLSSELHAVFQNHNCLDGGGFSLLCFTALFHCFVSLLCFTALFHCFVSRWSA